MEIIPKLSLIPILSAALLKVCSLFNNLRLIYLSLPGSSLCFDNLPYSHSVISDH